MKTKQLTPYYPYQNTEEWAIIERLLNDLMANQDIELKTAPEYVIGYIVRELRNKDLLLLTEKPTNKRKINVRTGSIANRETIKIS